MNRERALIFLSVLVIISPFVGLPYSWLSLILPLLGVASVLVVLSRMRLRTKVPTPDIHEKETPPVA